MSKYNVLMSEFLYGWAPGVLPMDLPPNVGRPMGLSSIRTFYLDFHYDNAAGEPNITNNSGIRMFYTSKKREFDLGVFVSGGAPLGIDPVLVSATPDLSQYVFDCWKGCSQQHVARPVTVIKELIHMHWTGVSASNIQIRDGAVVRQSDVQFWDFSQQGNFAAPQPPYEVLPGNTFRTICNYNALNNETWGMSSSDEMCQVYLYYYPRQVQNDMERMCGVGVENVLPDVNAEPTIQFRKAPALQCSWAEHLDWLR